jgi:ubiquinone/menaquinone biosynthesis C-methylase UbiE
MIRVLNTNWRGDTLHHKIAEIVGVRPGQRVLDLGCGRGGTLAHLLSRAGAQGRVTALDRDDAALRTIEERHANEVTAGRLEVRHGDLTRALPFADKTFDAVICQNVIECVPDRRNLIEEMWRVMRPDGHLLVGQHDVDAVVLAASDRALTRRVLHAYADHEQASQDLSDGQMGRQLPGLFHRSRFQSAESKTVMLVDFDLSKGSYAAGFLAGISDLARDLGFTAEEFDPWLADLNARVAAGTFYFGIPWIYVLARR